MSTHKILAAFTIPVVATQEALPGQAARALKPVKIVKDLDGQSISVDGEMIANPIHGLGQGYVLLVNPTAQGDPVRLNLLPTHIELHPGNKQPGQSRGCHCQRRSPDAGHVVTHGIRPGTIGFLGMEVEIANGLPDFAIDGDAGLPARPEAKQRILRVGIVRSARANAVIAPARQLAIAKDTGIEQPFDIAGDPATIFWLTSLHQHHGLQRAHIGGGGLKLTQMGESPLHMGFVQGPASIEQREHGQRRAAPVIIWELFQPAAIRPLCFLQILHAPFNRAFDLRDQSLLFPLRGRRREW